MSRPEVTLANADQWIPWYENHRQHQAFARFGHAAMARFYNVNMSADDNVPEVISDARGQNSTFAYYSNHLTDRDPTIVLAITEFYDPFHFMRGNTFIQSKAGLFDQSTPKHWLRRYAIDELGAWPTFRLKSDLNATGIELTPELLEMHRNSTDLSNAAQIRKHLKGGHEAVFGEGGRNKENFRVVQPLKKGTLRKLISVVEQGLDVHIIPVGMWLGDGPAEDIRQPLPYERSPFVHIARPLKIETDSVDTLKSMLYPVLQGAVNKAIENAGDVEPLASAG